MSGAFKRTVKPGLVDVGGSTLRPVYVTITWDGRRLSLSGVEGPKSNGDAWGGCGQIHPLRLEVVHTGDGWTAEMIEKLNSIWERWHLNDMRAACEHQREAGWKVCRGHYAPEFPSAWLYGSEAHNGYPREGAAIPEQGLRFTVFNAEGLFIDRKVTWTFTNCAGREEEARLEHTRQSVRCSVDCLSKPCPTCGYKYGTKWLFEQVPADVVEWLEGLPESGTDDWGRKL